MKNESNYIIDVYNNRKSVEKYSRLVSFDEIQNNDFNLNIPRYVDTFEDEQLIDIDEVRGNIKKLKIKINDIESKLNNYLVELGLEE